MVFRVVSRETVGEIFEEIEQGAATIVIHFPRLLGAGPGRLGVLRHAVRQVAIDTTRTIVGCVQTRARHSLVGIHQVFAFAEGVERHGHRTNVQCVTADPQQVIQNPGDFVEHRPDVLAPFRHLDTKQLLDCQAVGMLVRHRRNIVQTIHIRNGLHPGTGFGELLGGPVQQTDVRVGALNDFTVQFEHETQYPVGRRVLRTEVECEIADISHVPDPRRCLRARCAGCSHVARWLPVGKSRAPDQGHNAFQHDRKSGNPCGTDDR